MVVFRGLSWRSTTPVSRLERSDLSQTTPSSPAEVEVPSVQTLVDQLEAKEEQSRRRSSVGDRPSTPNFRANSFRPLIPYSHTPSPKFTVPKVTNISREVSVAPQEVCLGLKARTASFDLDCKTVPLIFTTTDGDSIYQSLSLPSTPVGINNTVPDSELQHPESPAIQAVAASAVDLEVSFCIFRLACCSCTDDTDLRIFLLFLILHILSVNRHGWLIKAHRTGPKTCPLLLLLLSLYDQ